MERKRHSSRRILDGNTSCGGVNLSELVQITEYGFGHGVYDIGAQTFARNQKVDHCGRLDVLRLPLVPASEATCTALREALEAVQ